MMSMRWWWRWGYAFAKCEVGRRLGLTTRNQADVAQFSGMPYEMAMGDGGEWWCGRGGGGGGGGGAVIWSDA